MTVKYSSAGLGGNKYFNAENDEGTLSTQRFGRKYKSLGLLLA